MPSTRSRSSVLFTTIVMLCACSGGGGGGAAAPEAGPPASVPDGTGITPIQMTGTWEIQNATVIDSSSTDPAPPLNGTTFRIDGETIVEIGGLSVAPEFLSILLGAPLESYVNEVNGLTLMYQVVVDRREAGGTREEIAVAGGAFDPDSISVEAYSISQSPNDAQPVYTLSRYSLIRQSTTAPVQLGEELPAGQLDRTVQRLFGNAFGQR